MTGGLVTPKLRISFVTTGLAWVPGGSHRMVYEYANGLSARGHKVCIIHPPDEDIEGHKRPSGFIRNAQRRLQSVRKAIAPARPGWFALRPEVRATKLTTLTPYSLPASDIVIAMNWNVVQRLHSVAAVLGVPMAQLAFHYEVLGGYPKEKVDAALALPMLKVAISRWTCDILTSEGFCDVQYVPTGLDHKCYRVAVPPEKRRPAICAAFSPKWIKDPDTLVRTLENVKHKVPDAEVILFGASSAPRLPFKFTYYRRASDEFVARQIYNQSAIFLSSSRFEGFSFPAAEAMACGCAVVATDSGGNRDFARNEETALLCEPGDVESLTLNAVRVLSDSSLRLQLVRNGIDLIQTFTWEDSSVKLEKLLVERITHHKTH